MHRSILDHAPDAGEVLAGRPFRFLRSSSAPLPPSVLTELEATFGAPVVEAVAFALPDERLEVMPGGHGTNLVANLDLTVERLRACLAGL